MSASPLDDSKAELGHKIVQIKNKKGITWSSIAEHIGHNPVFTCAACLGEMSLTQEAAEKLVTLLGLDADDAAVLQTIPYRGNAIDFPPSDPTLYRLHEMMLVYGPTLKQLIHEEFGDGIMSAIDFDMKFDRQADAKGDRVKIEISGKFLPYKRY